VLGQSIDRIGTSGRDDEARAVMRATRSRISSGPRRVSRPRTTIGGEREATIAQALRRLEREHIALLLAICELEGPTGAQESPAVRQALLILLRDDLSRVQRALALAAEGRYGSCEQCGLAIMRRELELSPATVRCHTCQAQ
jgi:hypothetical protein